MWDGRSEGERDGGGIVFGGLRTSGLGTLAETEEMVAVLRQRHPLGAPPILLTLLLFVPSASLATSHPQRVAGLVDGLAALEGRIDAMALFAPQSGAAGGLGGAGARLAALEAGLPLEPALEGMRRDVQQRLQVGGGSARVPVAVRRDGKLRALPS